MIKKPDIATKYCEKQNLHTGLLFFLHLFNLMYSFKISFYRVHPSMGAEK